MTQSRWKSKVLWTAIISQVLAILSFVGLPESLGISTELVSNIAGGVLQLLVLFGVINNPTDSENI